MGGIRRELHEESINHACLILQAGSYYSRLQEVLHTAPLTIRPKVSAKWKEIPLLIPQPVQLLFSYLHLLLQSSKQSTLGLQSLSSFPLESFPT